MYLLTTNSFQNNIYINFFMLHNPNLGFNNDYHTRHD